MTDVTRNDLGDATLSAFAKANHDRLQELDRLVLDEFSDQLFACFNACVGDECVIACEIPRDRISTITLSEDALGIITLGTSTPSLIDAGARRDGMLTEETIVEIVSALRDRAPETRWLVVRAATGAVSTRLLVRRGASA